MAKKKKHENKGHKIYYNIFFFPSFKQNEINIIIKNK